MFAIDPAATAPPYAQVRDQVAVRIRDGSLPVGARLPTVRALAADLDLAPNTVARAYRELERAGLVETHGRRGTSVAPPSDALRRAREAAQAYAESVGALDVTADEALALVAVALEPSTAWPRAGDEVAANRTAVDLRRGG